MRRARCAIALGASGALLSLTACGTQTPDPDAYRDRSELAVSAGLTSVATVQLVMEHLVSKEVLGPYAAVVVQGSDESLGTAITKYTALDPPRSKQALFERTSTMLGDAEDLLEQARITVNRGDSRRYPGLARELDKMSRRLDRADKALQ